MPLQAETDSLPEEVGNMRFEQKIFNNLQGRPRAMRISAGKTFLSIDASPALPQKPRTAHRSKKSDPEKCKHLSLVEIIDTAPHLRGRLYYLKF